ncbi:pyridoxamine 5'-phosphate oxidase family protein [Roseobacter sp. HKCCA0434]|uniref:pyridoxamine 5'-phosphate oxidase family protein n=1 Tax=Roseobacter sp. HKCCA0434 TaxID=3079297 RepID=UPI002905E1C0|nr:pyridoxamine 5'-phosphate oxidase family protein [Roseobacter sp. HKCCA0434]
MPRPFDPDYLLARPLMANLATVDADGAPRNAPVWYIWEGGALWMLGTKDGSSARRIAANPQVAVEIVDFRRDDGILLHLGLRGRARIEPNDADRFRRLLANYLGADDWNPWFVDTIARIDDPDGRFIRLVPDSTFTNNVSYFRTGPDLAWDG